MIAVLQGDQRIHPDNAPRVIVEVVRERRRELAPKVLQMGGGGKIRPTRYGHFRRQRIVTLAIEGDVLVGALRDCCALLPGRAVPGPSAW